MMFQNRYRTDQPYQQPVSAREQQQPDQPYQLPPPSNIPYQLPPQSTMYQPPQFHQDLDTGRQRPPQFQDLDGGAGLNSNPSEVSTHYSLTTGSRLDCTQSNTQPESRKRSLDECSRQQSWVPSLHPDTRIDMNQQGPVPSGIPPGSGLSPHRLQIVPLDGSHPIRAEGEIIFRYSVCTRSACASGRRWTWRKQL